MDFTPKLLVLWINEDLWMDMKNMKYFLRNNLSNDRKIYSTGLTETEKYLKMKIHTRTWVDSGETMSKQKK